MITWVLSLERMLDRFLVLQAPLVDNELPLPGEIIALDITKPGLFLHIIGLDSDKGL